MAVGGWCKVKLDGFQIFLKYCAIILCISDMCVFASEVRRKKPAGQHERWTEAICPRSRWQTIPCSCRLEREFPPVVNQMFLFRRPLSSLFRSMSSHAYLDASPPAYNGSKHQLDKSVFHKTLSVLAARVPPSKTGQILKARSLKEYVINSIINRATTQYP